MGMYGTLRQVTPEELSAIAADPDFAYDLALGTSDSRAAKEARARELIWAIHHLQKRLLIDTGIQARYADAWRRGEQLEQADQEAYNACQAQVRKMLEDAEAGVERAASDREVGLDKAWQGLHFLLTGHSEGGKTPWSLAILGGKEVPDRQDVLSFGGIVRKTVKQTAEVAAALSTVPVAELIGRYNLDQMLAHSIYAMGTDAVQDRAYLAEYYERLQNFYARAARENCGALFFIT